MIFGELEFKQIGRLADNPTYRLNANGTKVANFRVITNVGWKDKTTGEMMDRAEGFRYELWGDPAERIAQLQKGAEIYVVAEPYNDRHEVAGEATRYEIRFRVTKWRELGRRGKTDNAADAPRGGDASSEGGDIPF